MRNDNDYLSMEYLTVEQLSEKLNISLTSAYQLVKKADFPSIKIGGTYRIPAQLFNEWIDNKLREKGKGKKGA